jgi:glutathione S-transferase
MSVILYYSSGACSIGIHLILEEIGKPFTTIRLDLKVRRDQYQQSFATINAKSKVPTLVRDDSSVLTEFPAIAFWLACANPECNLISRDVEGQARALEVIDYVVSTMHMQGFARLLRPTNFTPNEKDSGMVRERGHEIIQKGFGIIEERLKGREYYFDEFTIADAALFYIELWAIDRLKLDVGPVIAAHYARLRARPTAIRVFQKEDLDPNNYK